MSAEQDARAVFDLDADGLRKPVPMPIQDDTESKAFALPRVRLTQLDALRGVAAMVVVLNHYIQTVPEGIRQLAAFPGGVLNPLSWTTPWPWLRATPLRLFVSGEAAVDLFFVLSGFVLSLGITHAAQPSTIIFLIKRICRVYLPFVAVLCASAAAYTLVPPVAGPEASGWFTGLTAHAANGRSDLIGHLAMTGRAQDMTLNPVMWTLVHEMRVSFAMPFLFLAIRRIGAVWTVSGCFVISLLASIHMQDSISGDWHATAHFLWMFALGSMISRHRHALAHWISHLSWEQRGALWLCALLLLACPFSRVWSDFLICGGAGLLIVLCMHDNIIVRSLNSPVPRWLGRVSYSLYLIHLPILIFFTSAGLRYLSIILVLTLILSEVTYRLIESKAHGLGLWLERRMK